MSARRDQPATPASQGGILAIVLIYTLFAGLWILLSDKVVQLMFSDPAQITLASMFKGWLFVGVTALLLYGLMKRLLAGKDSELQRMGSLTRIGLPFALLAAAILALAGAAIAYSLVHQKEKVVTRLQDIAELKAVQVADWLYDRSGDAHFVQNSRHYLELYRGWQHDHDDKAGRTLQSRLLAFCATQGCDGISLFGPEGRRAWGSETAPPAITRALPRAVRAASATHAVTRLGPYVGTRGNLRLDFVVPLTALPGPAPVVVLHVDPRRRVFSRLQDWPMPSSSGETVLFRREGGQILMLNDLRFHPDAAARLRIPQATEQLIFGQAMPKKPGAASLVEGLDYRGVAVLGVTRAVPGTDWLLTAKLDQSEAYTESIGEVAWIGFSALLALLISGAGLVALRQQQQLALAQGVQSEQAQRLHAQRLLSTIADSSTDAIFAKDLDGRYLLFNREAERLTGKTAQEVLGLDDGVLFPPEQARQIQHNDREVIATGHATSYQENLTTTDGDVTYLATKGPLLDAHGKPIGLFGISRNITQIKRALEALAHERDRNQRYLDTVQTMLVALDTQGRITMINRAGCAMLGYSEQDLLGRNWFDTCLPQPEGIEKVYPVFLQVVQGDIAAVEYFDNTVRCRNGDLRLVAWHNALLTDETGRIIGVLSSGEDVTEQQQAEAALRDSEAFKRAILDAVSAQIAVLDAQGTIIAVNRPWLRFAEENAGGIAGIADQVGVGINYLDVCRHSLGTGSANAREAADGIERVLAGLAMRFSLEYPCDASDVARWFSMTVTPLGAPGQGAVVVHTDITARKTAEDAIGRQAEELRLRNEELERFNRAVVGRELDMVSLKQQINTLSRELGLPPPYPLSFLHADTDPHDHGGQT